MGDYTERLGISAQKAKNLATAYVGYASVLKNEEENLENLPWIASNLAIGASFQLLFDPIGARLAYYRAAVEYRRLGSPFWIILAICSDNMENMLKRDTIEKRPSLDGYSNPFYERLAELFTADHFAENGNPFSSKKPENQERKLKGKIDTLDIPYDFVLAVIKESNSWHRDSGREEFSKFSELIRRIYELIESKQQDTYHWKNLQGSVLPIDPMSLALILVPMKNWTKIYGLSKLERNLNIADGQFTLLEIANEILTNRN